jgi:membrane protease YdiL (CAAX protease family)
MKSIPFLHILNNPLVRFLILTVGVFYFYLSGHMFRPQFAHGPLQDLAVVFWMVVMTLFAYASFIKTVEKRPASEVSLQHLGSELGAGILLGSSLYTFCILVLMLLGVYKIDGLNSWSILLNGLWFGLSSGFFEELLFRGILFRITEEVFGTWTGLCVSSLAFGLIHLNNPGSTYEGVIFIAVEFGILTAACYMYTRRLWLSMGVHMAWNYTQSSIFSGIGSGNGASHGLINATINGPDYLTGGKFGMESSVVALIICTTVGFILVFKSVKRKNLVSPFWKR